MFERSVFHKHKQLASKPYTHHSETVEEFARKLLIQCQRCSFKDPDDQTRDRFVWGLLDHHISQKLQMKADLTLDTAIKMVRQ